MNRPPKKIIMPVKGGVTASRGFFGSGVAAGIKSSGLYDLGVIFSKKPCAAAGTFTKNAVKAECVKWNSGLLPSTTVNAIVCNSGNANACTGSRGESDVRETAAKTAFLLGVKAGSVLVASTGVIGEYLPMEKLRNAIPRCVRLLSRTGGAGFAKAIMTTDTKKKEYAVEVSLSSGKCVIGGCVKGSGMIHPNMATMLGFITSDIKINALALNSILKRVVDRTFNNLTVDGDTSTNDMALLLANGMSGVSAKCRKDLVLFEDALFDVCNNLCAKIALDGEGATKRIEVNVTGGKTFADCKLAAKAVANSNLVKTAMFGNDPNWGRILCAIGYSGAGFSEKRITVSLCGTLVFSRMRPVSFSKTKMRNALRKKTVIIDIDLGHSRNTCAVAHTCDFSYEYVRINAEYHT